MLTDTDPATPLINGLTNVYFQNLAGFFRFSTRMTAQDERVIHVVHAERIKRYQRRRYSRKRLQLPVFVQSYRSASTAVKSVLMDLSGGGASLRNPGQRFRVGQQVEISFAPHGEKFHVVGRVVRISRGGQMLHVEFQALDEPERERIVRSAAKRRNRGW